MLRALVCSLGFVLLTSGLAQAQDDAAVPFSPHPYARELRAHYYRELARSPAKAFLWDLALPGAGSVYTGIYMNTAISAGVTLLGSGLWVAGAATDNRALWWGGLATFCAGRVYGLISAPVGARLLNAAFRRQLGL